MGRWPSDEDDKPRYASDARDEDEAADDELEGEWELDPNDPTHPDHDLSVDAGYAGWEESPRPRLIRRGYILVITVLVIIGLTVPMLIRLTY